MSIDLLWLTFWLLIVVGAFFLSKQQGKNDPAIPVSSTQGFSRKKSWKIFAKKSSEKLFWLSCFFLALSLSNPTWQGSLPHLQKPPLPRKGIALYFLLDQSGSMDEIVTNQGEPIRKIDLAKKAISQFIQKKERKSDLVGLVGFARTAHVISPLTLDREELLRRLSKIEPVTEERLNGTAIGYAIFKTVNTMVATKYFASKKGDEPVFTIKNPAIVVITDGLQSPHPDDKSSPFRYLFPDEAIEFAKKNEIKVYFIGVDPIFGRAEFAAEVKELKQKVLDTGGNFFLMTHAFSVDEIFAKIDALEKSELPPEVARSRTGGQSLVLLFVICAFITLAFAMLNETVIARSYP